MTKNLYTIVFIVLVCTIVVISCSPKSSYHIKSFFFDGVPIPITSEIDSFVTDTLNITSKDSVVAIKKPQEIIHPPFQERNCNVCHQKYKRGESMAKNKELCYTCHEQFENSYQTLHGPVSSGYCTQCHNPHKSKNNALLLQSDNQLCLNCHDQAYVQQTKIHKTLDDTQQCLKCHSPHGSNNHSLLTQASCFECHENYTTAYTYVHGPVAAGLCANCHEDHNSKNEQLLVHPTNVLCLNCHNSKDINKTSIHKNNSTKTCTVCHNPHGGTNDYFLTQNTLQ